MDKLDLKLIKESEEKETLDFKKETYKIGGRDNNSNIIKDVIAMANTPRESPAYIVMGVEHVIGGENKIIGLSPEDHHDDADLRQIFEGADLNKMPEFQYLTPKYDNGKSLGVIEIPISKGGPFLCEKVYSQKIEAFKLYYRNGSRNSIATGDKYNQIMKWWHKDSSIPQKPSEPEGGIHVQLGSEWNRFFGSCHEFESNRLYLMILGPSTDSVGALWKALGPLPISVVLDFDPSMAAYKQAEPAMKSHRSVHAWSKGNEGSLSPRRACYWYAARGREDRPSTLVDDGWREWNQEYGKNLDNLFQELARASEQRPLTVISLWSAQQYLRSVCTSIDRMFEGTIDYVFASENINERIETLSDAFDASTVSISLEEILVGLNENIDSSAEYTPISALPSKGNSFKPLKDEEISWLREDLEVLHSSIEGEYSQEEEEGSEGHDFLKGQEISWLDIDRNLDIERQLTDELINLVKKELQKNYAVRLNLFHWPGSGGTTVSKRVAWELRRRYPVALLKRFQYNETIERLRLIYDRTELPTLVVVETSDVSVDQVESLYTSATDRNLSVVFLQVSRRFETPPKRERSLYLSQSLEINEAARFRDTYSGAVDGKYEKLDKLVKGDAKERTPFLFGLTAFGEDFVGIDDYVGSRIENANETQIELLTFISLIYYYGHKEVVPQLFAEYLGYPPEKTVYIQENLGKPQLDLIVQTDEDKLRPRHQLIAENILRKVMGTDEGDNRAWKNRLPKWGSDLIKICGESFGPKNDSIVDLLQHVYILRDERDVLGTESAQESQFATLLEDIPTREGKLSVLKTLTEFFPNEAHFWGHLGRFYSMKMSNYEKAVIALDKALKISPKDKSLHHMKGMSYRGKSYEKINKLDRLHSGQSIPKKKRTGLRETIERSLDSFEKARECDPRDPYGYISAVQLLIRTVEFGYAHSHYESRTEFLVSSPQWYSDSLDEAESLLSETRRIHDNRNPSYYVQECRSNLNELYDDYSRAIEGWTNLLDRDDVYHPPIRRQIVRTYLNRHDKKWSSLDTDKIRRIVEMLEENLQAEPDNERNIRLWFRAIRYLPYYDIDKAIHQVATWKSLSDSLDAYYYLYILHVLKALGGSPVEADRSRRLISECESKSQNRKGSTTRSYEFLGHSDGLAGLVHRRELGEWNDEYDFWTDTSKLARINGIISAISKPQAGSIELTSCGLSAFFVPGRANVKKGKDENKKVSFFLGFSYEGLRAWSVELNVE
jgi:tetratricopeptide (TPR) repeat protein